MSSTIIPALRYKDAPRMIDWLCEAFGFTRHFVVEGENGTIAHAQLTFGTGMIMLGSVRQDDAVWSRSVVQPAEIGERETQTPYVVVTDVDALHDRAKAAGAEILMPLTDQDYGSRASAAPSITHLRPSRRFGPATGGIRR